MSKLVQRSLLVVAAIVMCVAVPGGEGEPRASAQVVTPPNILLIVVDDQRATQPFEVMPRTYSLFQRRGRTFEQAFASSPTCCPSRGTIMSGQYAHNHGVRRNEEAENLDQEATLQRYLQAAGYRTGIFGKYLNPWNIDVDPPYFSRWAIVPRSSGGYYNGTWNVDGNVQQVPTYGTTFIRDSARAFLDWTERGDDRPWFLTLTPAAPHHPFTPEEAYRGAAVPSWEPEPGLFESDRADKPPFVQSQNVPPYQGRKLRRMQLRTLMSVDDMVDAVFERLKLLEEGSNTLAIYMSDNGFLWGDHRLRGKSMPYTPSVKIPLQLRWPGHIEPGSTDPRFVTNVDLAPTIFEAAGLEPPAHQFDGKSLLQDWSRDRLLLEFWNITGVPSWASTRTSDYQYMEYYDFAGDVAFREYYDLLADPLQLENLLGDRDLTNDPTDLSLIQMQLEDDRDCVGSDCP